MTVQKWAWVVLKLGTFWAIRRQLSGPVTMCVILLEEATKEL